MRHKNRLYGVLTAALLFGSSLIGAGGIAYAQGQGTVGGTAGTNADTATSGAMSARLANLPPEKRAALVNLARKFVDKVGQDFKKADEYWFSLQKGDAQKDNYLANIPDGEILILQIKLPGNVALPNDVIAEKQGRHVYISLSDFVTAANFPISVNAKDGTAKGWYIRQNSPFNMNVSAGTVQANGKNYTIGADDLIRKDDDILVKGSALSEWFGFDMQVNASTQSMDVTTTRKWPVEERMNREKLKGVNRHAGRGPAELPRLEEPYQAASIPNVDVFLSQKLDRRQTNQGTEIRNRSNYTVKGGGDLAGHTAEAVVSGDNKDIVSNVRLKLSKESDKRDLLGALKAREYAIGDVTTPNIPLAGGSHTELGARVSNADPNVTQDTTTTVTGFSVPGWDVELYRGDQFIAITIVAADGQYKFDEVPLYAGQNNFRVVQYGLQGEVQEQPLTLSVDPRLYSQGKGVYDVSVTMNRQQTYMSDKPEDQDRGTPHIVATYKKQITPDTTATAGLRVRQEEGKQKIYGQTGTVTTIGDTIVNADAVIDNKGAFATSVTARRSIKDNNFSGTAKYIGKDYNVDSDQPREREIVLSGQARGPIPYAESDYFQRPHYDAAIEYRRRGSDYSRHAEKLGLSARAGRMHYSTTVNMQTENTPTQGTKRTLDGCSSIRGNAYGVNWRATSIYQIYPDMQAREYDLAFQKTLAKDIQGQATLQHKPLSGLTEGELSMSWNAEHVLLTPSLRYDTDHNLSAYLNARFGLSYDPYGKKLEVKGKALSGQGGVSALVYLDKDGSRTYNKGDELLKDVRVQATQSFRSAFSDKDGEAFLADLPTNRVTDISVDESSLPDPYWVSVNKGASVHPRPGYKSRLEFPIQISGEIDGHLMAEIAPGVQAPLKNVRIHLYDSDGKIVDTQPTAFDGFYVFSRVTPGQYLIAVDNENAKDRDFLAPSPKKVTIGYDGTMLYGQDLIAHPNSPNVGFSYLNLASYEDQEPNFKPDSLRGQKIILNLGEYNSRLLEALTWYNLKTNYSDIIGRNAKLLVEPSESYASVKTGKHIMRVKTNVLNMEDARFICRSLHARGFSCDVELVPADAVTHEAAAGGGTADTGSSGAAGQNG